MTMEALGQKIGSGRLREAGLFGIFCPALFGGTLAITNPPMAFGVPRSRTAANRRADVFLDFWFSRKEQWTIRNSIG